MPQCCLTSTVRAASVSSAVRAATASSAASAADSACTASAADAASAKRAASAASAAIVQPVQPTQPVHQEQPEQPMSPKQPVQRVQRVHTVRFCAVGCVYDWVGQCVVVCGPCCAVSSRHGRRSWRVPFASAVAGCGCGVSHLPVCIVPSALVPLPNQSAQCGQVSHWSGCSSAVTGSQCSNCGQCSQRS